MSCNAKTGCEGCGLSETRIQMVRGEGAYKKGGIVVVGEAPGGDEDEAGRPFVGTAGKTLRTLMADAGLDPANCWITNLVKCRPPGNRRPTSKEKITCWRHLEKEISDLQPSAIVAVGLTSAQTLLNTKESMAQLIERGGEGGIPVIIEGCQVPVYACYHSSPLCTNRTPGAKDQIRRCFELALQKTESV